MLIEPKTVPIFLKLCQHNREEPTLHNEDGYGYATFSLTHFCFVTLRATTSIDLARRRGYCMCPMFPASQLGGAVSDSIHIFHLCVTYYMKPCLEVRTMHVGHCE